MGGRAATLQGLPPVASVAPAPSVQLSPDLSEAASRPVAARLQVRMGRAASAGGPGLDFETWEMINPIRCPGFSDLGIHKPLANEERAAGRTAGPALSAVEGGRSGLHIISLPARKIKE